MQTPVLLVIFKRPELTRRTLAAIRASNPSVLLVAADGPRGDYEAAACAATRRVLQEFEWPCEVVTNFAEVNMGCGIRMHSAISWALSLYERVAILEDDCVPHASFFRFCDELLDRYRDDERVMHITGHNFVGSAVTSPYSYYFSKIPHGGGWATWRRAWRHFDWAMKLWPEAKAAGVLEAHCSNRYELAHWGGIWDRMYEGAPDVWDYQWNFACWTQSGLAIVPAVNLVTNVGFGADATHSTEPNEYLSRPAVEIGELSHPPLVFRNDAADSLTFDRNLGGFEMKARDSRSARLRRRFGPALVPLRMMKRMHRRLARALTSQEV